MIKIDSAFDDDGREYFFAREILFKEGKEVFNQVVTESSYLREFIEEAVKWLQGLESSPKIKTSASIGSDFDDFLEEEGILEEVKQAALTKIASFFPQVQNKELFPSLQILPFPEVENAYLIFSFFTVSKGKELRSRVSFLYQVNASLAVEWDIESSDFILYRACDKQSSEAARHFFFEAVVDYGEVIEFKATELGLAQQVKAGNFKEVFQILKTFGENCA